VTDHLALTGKAIPRRQMLLSPVVIAIGVGVLAVSIYLWQLSVPEFFAFYDTGVFMAASIHFVSGVFPYKDFTFVNPPGILLLMSPVALFARVFGSHDGLILARVLTSIVTALNASLLAWLVRHRGRMAMVMAGIGLALLPITLFVSSDLKLDPYSICFVLLGSVAVLSNHRQGREITTRALVIGGVLFGVAAVIKLWAFFPFLALLICLSPKCRRRLPLLVGGAALGFIVPSLPFFILAPGNFINQVFTVQLFQSVNPGFSPGVPLRLSVLTGLYPTSITPTSREAIVIFASLFAFVGVATIRNSNPNVTDAYLVITSVITVCALLAAPAFQLYYAYFAAPFLVGAISVSMSRLGNPVKRLVGLIEISRVVRSFLTWTIAGIGILVVFALVLNLTTFYTNYAWFYGLYGPNVAVVDRVVPSGSCVVYDFVFDGVYTNRLSNDPGCPRVVDSYGMWQEWGNHLIAPSPRFVSEWKGYFQKAQYVVLHTPKTSYIPWDTSLTKWFDANYHLLYGKNSIYIYSNDSNT